RDVPQGPIQVLSGVGQVPHREAQFVQDLEEGGALVRDLRDDVLDGVKLARGDNPVPDSLEDGVAERVEERLHGGRLQEGRDEGVADPHLQLALDRLREVAQGGCAEGGSDARGKLTPADSERFPDALFEFPGRALLELAYLLVDLAQGVLELFVAATLPRPD